MKLKTLLLGSAGALAVVGGAQAADLSVAEPVEYVKVCDAFGVGYWYIPGSDTCLKLGGYVRFEARFHAVNDQNYGSAYHSASWDFYTRADLTVTAKSMTEYGPLTAFFELQAQSDNNSYTSYNDYTGLARDEAKLAYLDSAYLEIGPLLAGRTGSVYDYAGGFSWDHMGLDSDAAADQVRLTWAMSGFGILLAIEDPRDRWGTSLSATYSLPNIVAAITTTQATWDGKLSFGFAETNAGSGFGAQAAATFKLDSIAKGDALLLKAAWAQGQVGTFGGAGAANTVNGGSVWSAAVSFKHFWVSTLSTAVTLQYLDPDYAANQYDASINLVWAPVTGFYAGIEGGVLHTDAFGTGVASDVWNAKIRLQRSF